MLLDLVEIRLQLVSESLTLGALTVVYLEGLCSVLDFKDKARLCSNIPKLSGSGRTDNFLNNSV